MREFKDAPTANVCLEIAGEEVNWLATFQGNGIVLVEALRYEKNLPGGVIVRGVLYGVRAWIDMRTGKLADYPGGALWAHRKDRYGDDKPSPSACKALEAACIAAAQGACELRPLGLLEGQVVADWNALRRAEEATAEAYQKAEAANNEQIQKLAALSASMMRLEHAKGTQ